MRVRALLVTAAMTLVMAPANVFAAPINFVYSGTIDSSTFSSIPEGTPFEGLFTIDSTAADIYSQTDLGGYVVLTSSVTVGPYSWSASDALLSLVVSGGDYSVFGGGSTITSGPTELEGSLIGYWDVTASWFPSPFTSDALPLDLPDIAGSTARLSFLFSRGGLAGTISSLSRAPDTTAPEPATLLLVGTGVAVAIRRRRSRLLASARGGGIS